MLPDVSNAKGPNMKKIVIAIAIMCGFWWGLPLILGMIGGEGAESVYKAGTAMPTLFTETIPIPFLGGFLNMFLYFPQMGWNMFTSIFSSPVGAAMIATKLGAMGAMQTAMPSIMKESGAMDMMGKLGGDTPEAPQEEKKEEDDISFVTSILKGASNNILVFLPPLWLVCGRPHTPKVNSFFDFAGMSTIDTAMAKIHPMWTVPTFKDRLAPGVRHKATRKNGAIEEGALQKKSDGEGYWLVDFTKVDPNADPMAAMKAMMEGGKAPDAPPKDLEWIPADNIVNEKASDQDLPPAQNPEEGAAQSTGDASQTEGQDQTLDALTKGLEQTGENAEGKELAPGQAVEVNCTDCPFHGKIGKVEGEVDSEMQKKMPNHQFVGVVFPGSDKIETLPVDILKILKDDDKKSEEEEKRETKDKTPKSEPAKGGNGMIICLALLAIAVAAYFFFFNKSEDEAEEAARASEGLNQAENMV